jgi:hypothetical protein
MSQIPQMFERAHPVLIEERHDWENLRIWRPVEICGGSGSSFRYCDTP